MALPLYLAMTAAEMGVRSVYPRHLAFMAVHFSPNGGGLSNVCSTLPEESMLILSDEFPWNDHCDEAIIRQLNQIVVQRKCESVLLDFQRPGVDAVYTLSRKLIEKLPCPVGVSHLYARGLSCPVFLPPVGPNIPVEKALAPWRGREIWLEVALDGCEITLTEHGSSTSPLPCPAIDNGRRDAGLHCHYRVTLEGNRAVFTMFRTRDDLKELLEEVHTLGVTRAVGLWQELN